MKINIFLLICVFMFCAAFAFSRPVTLKIGSAAPTGSPWDITLSKIAAEWKELTNGEVILKIYPGGVAGTEQDMIRRMRLNSLQGATLTSMGLNMIATDTLAVSLPFLIRDDDEFREQLRLAGGRLKGALVAGRVPSPGTRAAGR